MKALPARTRVLIVDDNHDILDLLEVFLFGKYDIVTALNGFEGLKTAREMMPDLIITDIMMPVMDGYQAMQAIRSQKAFQSLPIIALTARAMPEEQEKCMAAGANDYLTKPVDIERLLTLLRVWLFKQEMAA